MSDLYNSLKLKMQDTLRWKKGALPVVRVKSTNAAGLNDAIERLESLVTDRISKIKEAVRAGETIVSEESRQTERLIEDLRAEIRILKGKLKDTEEVIERKDLSHQRIEESLSVTIKNLHENIKGKEETLANRENEINNSKSTIEENIKKIRDLEIAHTKAQEEAANHARRVEELDKSSQEKIAALEAQLVEKEEIARQKTSAIRQLEQQLAAKVQEFDGALKNKQETLTQRESEIADLRSQLKRLTKGIGEMSLLFKEAEALTGIDSAAAVKNDAVRGVEELPVSVQSKRDEKVTPVVPDAPPEIVSPETFQNIISELCQATNVIAPLASLIIHQQAKALGESVEKFPRSRLPELLEVLAKDISDKGVQTSFLQHFTQNARMALN